MTALDLVLIVAGIMLAVGLLTVSAWLVYSWYLENVERRLEKRKGLYRDLVSDLANREEALLHPTIHQISNLYDLDALEAVLEEQARGASGQPRWLLDVYDELGLVDKYINRLRSARKWRDRAFAAELLGRVGGAKAVPALLETVVAARSEDSDVREVALRALARIGDPRAVDPLIQALETADPWLAPRIADILSRHGEAAVDPLIAVLNAGDHLLARSWAANVLGEVGAQRAYPSLVRLLDDPEDEVRSKAAAALGRLGDSRAVPHLLDHLLTDPTSFVRVRIAASLGNFGGPQVIDRLVRALGDPAWWVRVRSVEALEQIGSVAEGPLLIALDDADPEIRARAAVALERLGVPDNLVRMIESGERVSEAYQTLTKFASTGTREFLSELTQHDSRQVRIGAVAAIRQAGRRDLADELIRIAESDSEPSLRGDALSALTTLGIAEAVPAALSRLVDNDQRVRAAAAELVGQLGGPDTADQLRTQTHDDDPLVRAAAIRGLSGIVGNRAEPEVRRLLGDVSSIVRDAALLAAEQGRMHAVVPAVLECLQDGNPLVRRRAAAVAGTLGDSPAVPALLQAFPDESTEVSEAIAVAVSRLDPGAAASLVDALAASSDVESKLALLRTVTRLPGTGYAVLLKLSEDASPVVRAAAVGAIGRRCHRASEDVEEAVAGIRRALQDADERVRAKAVDAFSRAAGVAAVSVMAGLLETDPSPLVRERAALAIGLLGAAEGQRAVIAATRRAEPVNVRATATLAGAWFEGQNIVERVREMPDEGAARDFLRQRLERDSRFRLLARRLSRTHNLELRALTSHSDAESQAVLSQSTKSTLAAGDRVRLIGSLRSFQGEQSRNALLRMVREDPSPEVRTVALGALGDVLEEDELLATATRALGDPNVLVRRAGVALFAKGSPVRAVPTLIHALRVDDDPAVLASAAAVVEQQFDQFFETAQSVDADPDRAVLVLRIVRHMAHPDLASLPPYFARSTSPDIRIAVADLWRNRPDIADPAGLEGLTIDPEVTIRRSAAGAAVAAERYDLLQAMTQDPDSSVRHEVAISLAGAQPLRPAGLTTLETLAGDRDMAVRAAAYVAHLLQGIGLSLPPELDPRLAAETLRQAADLPELRRLARTSPSEERRLAAGLGLALLQDDVARDVARSDPAPSIRHRVSGALELVVVGDAGSQ